MYNTPPLDSNAMTTLLSTLPYTPPNPTSSQARAPSSRPAQPSSPLREQVVLPLLTFRIRKECPGITDEEVLTLLRMQSQLQP